MVPAKAIETAHAIHDNTKYDISYQAILDCLSPNKCFYEPLSGVDPTGCTVKDFLEFVFCFFTQHPPFIPPYKKLSHSRLKSDSK